MTAPNDSFSTDLSATASRKPVAGRVARFLLTDGREVEVQVPRAVVATAEEAMVPGFRIVVRRPDRSTAAELRASELLHVFAARAAAHALAAFAAGDLPRALGLADQAGGAWRQLGPLFQELAAARSSTSSPCT